MCVRDAYVCHVSVSIFFGAFAKLREATISFVIFCSVRMHWKQLGWQWKDFHEISDLKILRKSGPENSGFNYVCTRITRALREDRYTFMVISRSDLLRMKSVWH